MMLTSQWQLCLAHYCEKHGPTPLMVTEGLPVPCTTCYDDELGNYPSTGADRPRSSAPTSSSGSASAQAATAITEALRRINLGSTTQKRSSSVPSSEQEAQTHRAALLRAAHTSGASPASAIVETPPQSPRLQQSSTTIGTGAASLPYPSQKQRHDSGFRKTYDDYVTRRAGPCENCALTLPKRQEDGKGLGAADSRPDRGPTLRTRAPCARVYGGIEDVSPPTSQTSSSTASDDEGPPQRRQPHHHRTGTRVSTTSRSSTSSSLRGTSHLHYLDYTSTHEPVAPNSFSIIRAACLRTLSIETLPRTPTSTMGALSSPSLSTPTTTTIPPLITSLTGPPPHSPTPFLTTYSPGAAPSGGPIFFGDPVAGYTTAYIFRIPDVHARGHKRVYAFLALSTHAERVTMKTFPFVAAAFHDMAAWIQALAEAEAERVAAEASPVFAAGAGLGLGLGSGSGSGSGYGGGGFGGSGNSLAGDGSSSGSGLGVSGGLGSGGGSGPAGMMGLGGSSFLTSRRMGGGFGGGGGVALKQRGLPELVGLPDFFIELHSRFVRLLLELGVVLSS